MGKKRIVKKSGSSADKGKMSRSMARSPKKKLVNGVLTVQATYNNTILTLADGEGKTVIWSSSGSLGFSGAKKGTPFAAGKVGEFLAEKGQGLGLKEIDVVVRGVGSGRESAIRAFAAKGVAINGIKDVTPVPFNGPKPKKARRV